MARRRSVSKCVISIRWGGVSTAPSGLYARLCHAFLVLKLFGWTSGCCLFWQCFFILVLGIMLLLSALFQTITGYTHWYRDFQKWWFKCVTHSPANPWHRWRWITWTVPSVLIILWSVAWLITRYSLPQQRITDHSGTCFGVVANVNFPTTA